MGKMSKRRRIQWLTNLHAIWLWRKDMLSGAKDEK